MSERPKMQELLNSFALAAARHFEATVAGDYQTGNQEVEIINSSFDQLRAMGDEGQQALLSLLDHENKAVASMAAAYSLRYATTAAMAVLERLSQHKGLIGFHAREALDRWREGDWHLDE